MEVLGYITDKALILIPVLNIIGMIIKHLEKINDKYIPLIVLFFGVLGTLGIMGVSVDSVIQGVLVSGASVFGNQIVKQLSK
jgi:hypothetical protein